MATETRRAGESLALAVLLFAFGCSSPLAAPVVPPTGALFAWYSAPLETNFDATPAGARTGIAELYHVEVPLSYSSRVPVATIAELGIAEAAANGGIRTVHYADYELIDVLGIFVRVQVRVYGD